VKISYQGQNTVGNCGYMGCTLEEAFIHEHFPKEVKESITDKRGSEELVEAFDSLATTAFTREGLKEVLSSRPVEFSEWRIGEGLAELFLKTNFNVRFWHNYISILRVEFFVKCVEFLLVFVSVQPSWDLKNRNCSPSGVDLLGFVTEGANTLFVFCEPKTSSDLSCPPKVVYGRTVLRRQITALCTHGSTRNGLIQFLGFKVSKLPRDNPFRVDYEKALMTYVESDCKRLRLFGLLVRDTTPNEKDVISLYEHHKDIIVSELSIVFVGLYIPIKMADWKRIVDGGIA